jgi:ATP-dependent DNA helicase RecG
MLAVYLSMTNPDVLQNDITYLKGVGPKRADAFYKAGLHTFKDLLLYFPTSYINREAAGSVQYAKTIINKQQKLDFMSKDASAVTTFQTLSSKNQILITGTIQTQNIRQIRNNKKLLTLRVSDFYGDSFEITFFSFAEYFAKVYEPGMLIAVSGIPTINDYSHVLQFSHPEIDIIEPDDIQLYNKGSIIPKYKITEEMRKTGISIRSVRQSIHHLLNDTPDIAEAIEQQETFPETFRAEHSLLPFYDTVVELHSPTSLQQTDKARRRIKFEELFWYQLQIHLRRSKIISNEKSVIIDKRSTLARKLYDSLPFKLTSDQQRALRDFDNDFRSGKPMNRLLQGDVGSGKTIVSVLAMLMVIDAGYQVVMMAPTELLAEQHYLTIINLLQQAELLTICVELITSSTGKKARNQILPRISDGTSNIIIGTHSLFQNSIEYHNLALVVIDEQHRFGVEQRAELIRMAKSSMLDDLSPHLLYMTATPIPRTLTMSIYGDLDVSIIHSMPKNRKPIKTKVVFEEQRSQVYDFIQKELAKEHQVYIVYPLVEKSEKLELKSATEHYDQIAQDIFPSYKCGLLHGQMKWQEKEEIMKAFQRNEYQIMVATTVVEVGIDVPNATIMLIEDSSQFGLSQLHQLRGRVGRGSEQSYCFLMTKEGFKFKFRGNNNISENEKIAAIVRLKAMQETNDGFRLSEIDLQLRGPGDMLGTRQSGLPDFKYADVVNDVELLQETSDITKDIINADPNIIAQEHVYIQKYLNSHHSISTTDMA